MTAMSSDTADPANDIRRLMRETPRVALGTLEAAGGAPYVSLAMAALDQIGRPLLLLSDLADHTRNLRADSRVSLLFDGTVGLESPLAGARATVQGRIGASSDAHDRWRYAARHPEAELYAGFADFNLYRVEIERAHLVAGFGRIHWVGAEQILIEPAPALMEREADIVSHMNDDRSDAVQLYAERLLGRSGGDWRMTGVDPEGADLRRGGETARLWFDKRVLDAESCRVELVRLVKRARAAAGASGETRAADETSGE
jgi:putative heme iron utilization protein